LFVDVRPLPVQNEGTNGETNMSKLTALTIKNAKPGRHADGGGLYLLVKPTGGKSWLLRIQVDGKRRDIGLGSFDPLPRTNKADDTVAIPILHRKILTLAEAREKAGLLRAAAKAGLDPVAERDRERRSIPTFRKAAKEAHAALKEGWSEKGAKTFIDSLENHTFEKMGNMRVDSITAADITAALAPIWTTKPDMARKVRQRIGKVLNFAHGKGWRAAEAPGKSVSVGLPRQPKGGNYDAMPYADVPAFARQLRSKEPSQGRRALLLLILTVARPGEIRRGRWKQVDTAKRDWNRPAEIMKERVAHTVTLSPPALALLEEIKADGPVTTDALFFPNRDGNPISDMTMNKVLRDAGLPYDAHGFRSSFRDWAAENMPEIPDPVAEAALAHVVPDKVIRAYKRTAFIEMRRTLLDAWAQYIEGTPNVLRLVSAG
jgi:integrase